MAGVPLSHAGGRVLNGTHTPSLEWPGTGRYLCHMRMTEMTFPDARPVEGYGPGFFRIGGEVVQGPLLVGPGGVRAWAGPEDTAPLLTLKGEVDVLFLGMGTEIAHAPAALKEALEDAGIGVEAMASPTACRSYNVTLSEGRRVALAAMPVEATGRSGDG